MTKILEVYETIPVADTVPAYLTPLFTALILKNPQLSAMYEIVGKEKFYDIIKVYAGLKVRFPSPKVINEVLLSLAVYKKVEQGMEIKDVCRLYQKTPSAILTIYHTTKRQLEQVYKNTPKGILQDIEASLKPIIETHIKNPIRTGATRGGSGQRTRGKRSIKGTRTSPRPKPESSKRRKKKCTTKTTK